MLISNVEIDRLQFSRVYTSIFPEFTHQILTLTKRDHLRDRHLGVIGTYQIKEKKIGIDPEFTKKCMKKTDSTRLLHCLSKLRDKKVLYEYLYEKRH